MRDALLLMTLTIVTRHRKRNGRWFYVSTTVELLPDRCLTATAGLMVSLRGDAFLTLRASEYPWHAEWDARASGGRVGKGVKVYDDDEDEEGSR